MGQELITTTSNADLAHTDLEAIEQLPTLNASAYKAASLDDRSMSGWSPFPGSPNGDLHGEMDIMMGRSRDLTRNNGVAAGANQTLKDNIIGATLRLSAKPDYRLLGKDIEWAREWSKNTEAQFRSWAETTECDAGNSLNLLGLSLQMLSGAFVNGDGLALPIWKPRAFSRWGSRLHVIEADRLSTPYGMEHKKGLCNGVEQDQHGMPIAYHIMKNHPGDRYGLLHSFGLNEWERIPAFTAWGRRRVIHLHDKERAGQSRAAPLVKAVMREFNLAGKYTHTELQTAITNSLVAGVLQSDMDAETLHTIMGTNKADYEDSLRGFRGKLQPGATLKIPLGTTYTPVDSGRNTAGFEQYMMVVLRYIATGLNIPYELLMKDFSKTNYSSARAALLEAWRYFNGRRRWLSDYWLNEVYAIWLEEAIAHGRVEAPDYYENKYAYCRCRWIMSGRGWVDPVKEANGSKIKMEIGLSTLENECAEQGQDWEEVLEQTAYENARRKELGLPKLGQVQYAPVSPETAQDDEREDEQGNDANDDEELNGATDNA